jgi:hypothetical protein
MIDSSILARGLRIKITHDKKEGGREDEDEKAVC